MATIRCTILTSTNKQAVLWLYSFLLCVYVKHLCRCDKTGKISLLSASSSTLHTGLCFTSYNCLIFYDCSIIKWYQTITIDDLPSRRSSHQHSINVHCGLLCCPLQVNVWDKPHPYMSTIEGICVRLCWQSNNEHCLILCIHSAAPDRNALLACTLTDI